MKQWLCVVAGAGLVGWADAYTDEIPVVLGLTLIVSSLLGGVFPRKPWLTGFLLGVTPFVVESLLHLGRIRSPWAALFALIPALGGAFFGSAIRHLNKQETYR